MFEDDGIDWEALGGSMIDYGQCEEVADGCTGVQIKIIQNPEKDICTESVISDDEASSVKYDLADSVINVDAEVDDWSDVISAIADLGTYQYHPRIAPPLKDYDLSDEGLASSPSESSIKIVSLDQKPTKSILKSSEATEKKQVSFSDYDELRILPKDTDGHAAAARISYDFKSLNSRQVELKYYTELYEITQNPKHPEYMRVIYRYDEIINKLRFREEDLCIDSETYAWMEQMQKDALENQAKAIGLAAYAVDKRRYVMEFADEEWGIV